LILDDLPEEAAHSAKLQLAVLAEAVRRAYGTLICTSYRSPAPSLTLGTLIPVSLRAPYFNDDDVALMVEEAGGNSKVWAPLVKFFSGDGHPQLVAARVAGLKARGWPDSEMLAGIDPTEPLLDIEAERDSARNRLIRQLPSEATALLYRLTVCSGSFDRQMALAVGATPPPLSLAGVQIDLLLGPWIETVGRDSFRPSPLVEDAAEKNLTPAERAAVDHAIVDDLTSRRPFPGERLGLLFLSALRAQHENGLRLVALGVHQADVAVRRRLAQTLSPLIHLHTTAPIFPSNQELSALLRTTQLRLATFAKSGKIFAIAERLILETKDLEQPEVYRNAGIAQALAEPECPMKAAEWISLLPYIDNDLATPPLPGTTLTLSLRQFTFMWRTTHLNGVDQLADLFDELSKMDDALRDFYLNTLNEPQVAVRAFIQEPWVADSKRDDFDASSVAAIYARLAETARGWRRQRIVIECVGCQAVLLAEYSEDHVAAVAILDAALQEWPDEPRLLRELSKILFRIGDYAGAQARLRSAASRLPQGDTLERVYLFRELALSAAHMGNLDEAILALSTAHAAADGLATYQAKAVGLLADRAFIEFHSKRKVNALRTVAGSIAAADALDPTEPRAEFVLRMIGHLLLWMIYQTEPNRKGQPPAQPAYGFCSRDPPEFDWDQPLVPIEGLWYQLEEFEATLGVDIGISAAVEQRVAGRRIDFFEVQREFRAARRRVLTGDVVHFAASLRQHGPFGGHLEAIGPSEDQLSVMRLQPDTTWSAIPFDLEQPGQFKWSAHAALAFLAIARFKNGRDLTAELATELGAAAETAPLAQMLLSPRSTDGSGPIHRRVLDSFSTLDGTSEVSPTDLFIASAHAWIWLNGTQYRAEAGPSLYAAITERWRWIISNAGFALRQPSITTPAINAAINEAPSISQLARLLLAAEPAVRVRIDADVRSSFVAAAQEGICLES